MVPEGHEIEPWAAEQRRTAATWFREGSAGLGKVWMYFYGLGGEADELTLDAYLHELGGLPPLQARLLAIAMREMDSESGDG